MNTKNKDLNSVHQSHSSSPNQELFTLDSLSSLLLSLAN
jgi:hypothetical protein